MQVATLFREATTLLGASMEAPESTGLKLDCFRSAYQESGPMKQDTPHDDGYETAGGGEMDLPNNHHHHHHHNHQNHQNHHQNHQNHQSHLAMVTKMNNVISDGMMKYDMPEDPYSFVDDDHMMPPVHCPPVVMQQVPKKRGRKKKIKTEDLHLHNHNQHQQGLGYQSIMGCLSHQMKDANAIKVVKERKKHDRFNGMPEEEVSKRTLPDHLTMNLDIVIIGINPGLFAAYKGHHYAGPGNHFWKCLYLSGLTPEPMTADDDYKLLKVGIGFTNMVERATKGSADLTRKEIKEGSQILLEKLQKFKPKIAVFNGKLIFEVFSGKKDFSFGRQPELVDGTNTYMWVMPSSSARCAQLPRAADKVPFYAALKKFRDFLNGAGPEIDDKELVFSYSKLKTLFEPELKEDGKEGQGWNYNKVSSLTDISNNKKDDEPAQPKKKRGRPKKIKVDGEQKIEEPKPKVDDKNGAPKKKRGRPKKVKVDSENVAQSEHSNPPNHCFSPPIHSPSMQNFSVYQAPHYNQSSQSPLPNSYHQSPIQSHGYSQSPQPPSFTHSDLSSEISAAISSEQNPESPRLGPPDFEPPASMSEEVSKSPQPKEDDCHFSSPQSKKSYQNYDDFSTDSDSGVRYPQKQLNQDVTSKSLSGLESLVDQIPNITDGEPQHNVGSADSENLGSQYSEDSAYMSDYPRSAHFSPQYNTTTSSYLHQNNNFSVTSLANSSATDSTFSVSSLAGNYGSNYAIMGPPMPSETLFSNSVDRACRIDSNIPGNPSIPYPYSQYSNYNSSPGFYPPAPNLHMPSPNFPYPPYSNSSYPQGYLSNHMFDRIKSDRMDIGFGSF